MDMKKEILSPTVTLESLDEGKLVILTLADMTRSTVDIWVEACLQYIQTCHEEGWSLRILQDLSAQPVTQTPYSREEGRKLTLAYPDVGGKIAFVFPKTVSAQRMRNFIHSLPSAKRQRRVFPNREQALAWLQTD